MPKKKKKAAKRPDESYAHNPRYCMILPDAEMPRQEDISSTGQS